MDPGVRSLSARDARREEGDPAARRLGEVACRVHARPAALRTHQRAGREAAVRRGGRIAGASTVIVGGGVVGCAAAFFLADRGEHDVVLLERDQLRPGTSKGGLGGLRHQFVDELDVRTSDGVIACERVLLATGCWTAPLAATAGVAVPIWPYARTIMESRPYPALSRVPLTIEWESGFHFRPKGAAQRFAMPNLTGDGRVEKGPSSPPASFVPGEFTPLVVPPSLEPWLRARAAWRHPLFAHLRVTSSWSCYYEMTPDDHPIVGAVPEVAGLYIAAGFS